MHYLLFYQAVPDYAEKRKGFRDLHLKYANEAVKRGELVLAGAFADPIDGAVLLFNVSSKQTVEDFAKTDPYVTNGLVLHWIVREWTTVIGRDAAQSI